MPLGLSLYSQLCRVHLSTPLASAICFTRTPPVNHLQQPGLELFAWFHRDTSPVVFSTRWMIFLVAYSVNLSFKFSRLLPIPDILEGGQRSPQPV